MSRLLIEHGLRWRWKPSRILGLIRHPDCVVITAKNDIRTGNQAGLVGFAAMEFHETYGHLNLLAVGPDHRRSGIGRDLLQWLELSAVVAGLDHISLEVRSNNRQAISFYERAGYGIDHLNEGYYQGVEDAYQMTHQLISREIAIQRP